MSERRCMTDVFADRRGFTTVGAAIAILLSCTLVFFCLWSARAASRAAGVQAAVDAAALAAENEVAEFVLSVRVADATLLTMSLTGLSLLGAGAACCCVPGAAAAGGKLIDAGKAILDKRDDVAAAAERALNAAQDALPIAAQIQAQAVLQENAAELSGAAVGYVELVPADAPEVTAGASGKSAEAAQRVERESDQVAADARVAEEQSERAAQAFREGWLADCGNAPGYCMAERADALASMAPDENPIARSANTWSYDMALSRAQAYYQHRLSEEAPEHGGVEEAARSALRAKLYAYAVDELAKGYVRDDGVGVPDVYFPYLPRNTAEMKDTALYTDAAYAVSGGALHAYDGCPAVVGIEGRGSLASLDAGAYAECGTCRFSASSLGTVASASTSIENGFEYHYRKVAESAREYCDAKAQAAPAADSVKKAVSALLDDIEAALEEAAGNRVTAYPPGRFGALAACTFAAESEGSASSFFDEPDLGSFAAVSAAVLMEDADENALESLLDGVEDDIGPPLSDAGDAVLGLWAALLGAYSTGVDGLSGGVRDLLDAVPLASASGLGEWAEGALLEMLEGVGLEPANTAAAKATVCDSAPVAARGEGAVARAIAAAKGVP